MFFQYLISTKAEAAIIGSLTWSFLLWAHLELWANNLKQHVRVKGAWMDNYECYLKKKKERKKTYGVAWRPVA